MDERPHFVKHYLLLPQLQFYIEKWLRWLLSPTSVMHRKVLGCQIVLLCRRHHALRLIGRHPARVVHNHSETMW